MIVHCIRCWKRCYYGPRCWDCYLDGLTAQRRRVVFDNSRWARKFDGSRDADER